MQNDMRYELLFSEKSNWEFMLKMRKIFGKGYLKLGKFIKIGQKNKLNWKGKQVYFSDLIDIIFWVNFKQTSLILIYFLENFLSCALCISRKFI